MTSKTRAMWLTELREAVQGLEGYSDNPDGLLMFAKRKLGAQFESEPQESGDTITRVLMVGLRAGAWHGEV